MISHLVISDHIPHPSSSPPQMLDFEEFINHKTKIPYNYQVRDFWNDTMILTIVSAPTLQLHSGLWRWLGCQWAREARCLVKWQDKKPTHKLVLGPCSTWHSIHNSCEKAVARSARCRKQFGPVFLGDLQVCGFCLQASPERWRPCLRSNGGWWGRMGGRC